MKPLSPDEPQKSLGHSAEAVVPIRAAVREIIETRGHPRLSLAEPTEALGDIREGGGDGLESRDEPCMGPRQPREVQREPWTAL